MFNSEKPVALFIGKENLCDLEKAFWSTLMFQIEIGGESALINPNLNFENDNLSNVIAVGQNANLKTSSLQRIAILSDNPYQRISGETYNDWLERADDLHSSICNCYKIIVTTRDAYLAMTFKHQQVIYYVPFPPTVMIKKITKEVGAPFVVIKHKNSKIPGELIAYFKKIKHEYVEKNYDQNELLSLQGLEEILRFKELFWVGDLNLRYENIDINPILLSMSEKIIHVNDLSSYGSVTGLTFNECVRSRTSKTSTIRTSLAQQMGKQYLHHANLSVLASIKKHLI